MSASVQDAADIIDVGVLRACISSAIGSVEVPGTYMVIDTETTTTDPDTGSIWQIGMYPVVDGRPAYEGGVCLYPEISSSKLIKAEFEIKRRADAMAKASGGSPEDFITPAWQSLRQQCDANATPRKEAFEIMRDILSAIKNDAVMVGQNCVHFDMPFLIWEGSRSGVDIVFPARRLLDVGICIKASKLKMAPLPDEGIRSFYQRVIDVRARGVYYSLERFCIPYFGLDVKYGVNTASAHDAAYDCYVTALVMKEMVAQCLQIST